MSIFRRNNRLGLSYLEVLVTLAMLAILLPPLMKFGQIHATSQRIHKEFLAQELAISIMEELWFTGHSTDVETLEHQWGWNIEIMLDPIQSTPPTSMQVEIFAADGTLLASLSRIREFDNG